MLSLLRPPDARVSRSTRAEQETVIRWDRDADQMHAYSGDREQLVRPIVNTGSAGS